MIRLDVSDDTDMDRRVVFFRIERVGEHDTGARESALSATELGQTFDEDERTNRIRPYNSSIRIRLTNLQALKGTSAHRKT